MIEFDQDKDAANIEKHGVSLKRAGDLVFEDALVEADERFDYRESRCWLTVTWTVDCTFWSSRAETTSHARSA